MPGTLTAPNRPLHQRNKPPAHTCKHPRRQAFRFRGRLDDSRASRLVARLAGKAESLLSFVRSSLPCSIRFCGSDVRVTRSGEVYYNSRHVCTLALAPNRAHNTQAIAGRKRYQVYDEQRQVAERELNSDPGQEQEREHQKQVYQRPCECD